MSNSFGFGGHNASIIVGPLGKGTAGLNEHGRACSQRARVRVPAPRIRQ